MNPGDDVIRVWGHTRCPPPDGADVVLWAQFASDGVQSSLPDIVHSNSTHWKSEYARWMRDVGTSYLCTLPAKEFSRRHSGLSYWWMTLPTEFTFTRSSVAYTVMRLMALCDLLDERQPGQVILTGLPDSVEEVLQQWGRHRGVVVDTDLSGNCECASRTNQETPKSFAGLRYILSSLKHYGLRRRGPAGTGLVVIDYLTETPSNEKFYASRFWGPLVPVLEDSGPVTWLHHGTRDSSSTRTSTRRNYARGISREGSRHLLIQDALTPRVLIRALASFHAIRKIGVQAWSHVSFADQLRRIDLRPLIKDAWNEDHLGTRAGMNALDLHLMDSAVSRVDGPALYLMENQPWEIALLHAWKNSRQAPISGFVHSIARDWDLRLMLPRYAPVGAQQLRPPLPSLCLVGSASEASTLSANGYGPECVVEVEAVRFLRDESWDEPHRERRIGPRVLVLGEYDKESNAVLAEFLKASDLAPLEVVFRPHPSCAPDELGLPDYVAISKRPGLQSDLAACDAVIASTTSSAVKAVAKLRIPIVLVRDGSLLDGSDIDNAAHIRVSPATVANSSLLEDAEAMLKHMNVEHADQHFDHNLDRWKRLIRGMRSSEVPA